MYFFQHPEDQGWAGGSVGAGALGEAGAGTFVPSPLLGFAEAGGAGMLRLCFCASGITSGPF
ncbi:MAG TPA: hypothetical protein VKH13_00630 [Steroidobacteraceae bacterium]|nr:hypothetical protein [Steroidobacteraceae bacterium]